MGMVSWHRQAREGAEMLPCAGNHRKRLRDGQETGTTSGSPLSVPGLEVGTVEESDA